jgi:hypothetical protein
MKDKSQIFTFIDESIKTHLFKVNLVSLFKKTLRKLIF